MAALELLVDDQGDLLMDDVQGLTVAAIALLAVLAVCFVALVGLVVTLPAVTHWFRKMLHIGPGLPDAHRAH